jgi:hypothetical protein
MTTDRFSQRPSTRMPVVKELSMICWVTCQRSMTELISSVHLLCFNKHCIFSHQVASIYIRSLLLAACGMRVTCDFGVAWRGVGWPSLEKTICRPTRTDTRLAVHLPGVMVVVG